MDKVQVQRRLLAVLMESPLYFIPLKRRLEFIKFFSLRFDLEKAGQMARTFLNHPTKAQ